MKRPAVVVIAVLILSLIVWLVFHYLGLDLTRDDTFVVVGFMVLLVLGTQWAIGRLTARRKRR
jgi:hypothetical protein